MTRHSGSPQPDRSPAPSHLTRRGLVVLGLGAAGGAAFSGARWFNVTADVSGSDLTVTEAYEAALAQTILLVDIRRPDEWARTGVGAGALALDMRRTDFVSALLKATAGRRDMPVALICARGVRSRHLAARLRAVGFTRIIDVPEGMMGSGAGPGWSAQGLPVIAAQS